jgi:hypothetical protein
MYFSNVKPALSADSYFTVTIATVHRFVTTGFKGYLGILAALGTFCRKHLPLGSVARATISITLWFPCLATGWTALRLVGKAFASEELLLRSGEGEF